MKILPEMHPRTRKNLFNFGIHPLLESDPGIFLRMLQRCVIEHFLQLAYLSGKTSEIFMKIIS